MNLKRQNGSLTLVAVALIGGSLGLALAFAIREAPVDSGNKHELASSRASARKARSGTETASEPRAREDALALFDKASESEDLFERQRLLSQSALAADVGTLRTLLMECEEGDKMALQMIATRWAEVDPHSMLTFLLSESGAGFRANKVIYSELFARWGASDPDGALAAIAHVTPKLRDAYERQLIGHLLIADPEKGLEIAAAKRSIGHGIEHEFVDWSDNDPEEAARLLGQMPRCNFKSSAALSLALRWGESDPASALEFAQKLEPVLRDRAEEKVVLSWMKRDLEAARKYAESMGGGALARVGRQLVGEMAVRDPAKAMAWVDQFLTGQPRSQAIEQLVKRSIPRHPEQTAQIVVALPHSQMKAQALERVAGTWYKRNPDAALAWVDALAPGYEKDTAAEAILSVSGRK